MMRAYGVKLLLCLSVLCALSILAGPLYAGNEILGEIHLKGASGVEKTAGVWIDGKYVGYLKELHRSKKILLLPGEHQIVVRQAGYRDFVQQVMVEPGEKHSLGVALAKDFQVKYPDVKETAEIKLAVEPLRAAIFVDGLFMGHAAEFDGAGKALLVAPGKRKITISLPGYEPLETVVELVPHQKFKLATNLIWNGVAQAPALRSEPQQ
jgi:hypothetical protein